MPDGIQVNIDRIQYTNDFMLSIIDILNAHPNGSINPPVNHIVMKYPTTPINGMAAYMYITHYTDDNGLSSAFFVITAPHEQNTFYEFTTQSIHGTISDSDLTLLKQVGESFKFI